MTFSNESILAGLGILLCLWMRSDSGQTTSSPAPATQYTLRDLGCLPDCDVTSAVSLNNQGQVVGFCYMYVPPGHLNDWLGHAFLWEAGKMQALPTLGGKFNHALAINEAGDIAGDAQTKEGKTVPVLWSHEDRAHPVPISLQNGTAYDYSLDGQITRRKGALMLQRKDSLIPLNLPTANRFCGLNSQGEAVGYTYGPSGFSGGIEQDERGFVWRQGKTNFLPTLGGKDCACLGINANGLIIGWSETSGKKRHACFWNNDTPHDLGTLEGEYSQANGVNKAGAIVGESNNAQQSLRACLWDKGAVTDLNTVIPADSDYVLYDANQINDKGEIIAFGGRPKEQARRAFLLSPVMF